MKCACLPILETSLLDNTFPNQNLTSKSNTMKVSGSEVQLGPHGLEQQNETQHCTDVLELHAKVLKLWCGDLILILVIIILRVSVKKDHKRTAFGEQCQTQQSARNIHFECEKELGNQTSSACSSVHLMRLETPTAPKTATTVSKFCH